MSAQVEGQDEEQLRFLLAHDRDPFCRWEAGQRLLRSLLLALYAAAADESKARAWPVEKAQALISSPKFTYTFTVQYHTCRPLFSYQQTLQKGERLLRTCHTITML